MSRMMTIVSCVMVLVCASAPAALRVPLTVTEPVGTARENEPVTVGVPLARGAVKDVGTLRLLDAAGGPVPAQFRVLTRYWKGVEGPKDAWFANGDGSIKWALVDLQATVATRGKAAFVLTDAGPAALKTTLVVKEEPGRITVNTGPLQFALSRKRFRMFETVSLGGREVLKAADGSGFAVVGMDGKCYHSGGSDGGRPKVTVEESGPLRAVIKVEGEVKAGDNAGGYDLVGSNGKGTVHVPGRDGEKLGYTVRLVAYAGKPFVRVFHTVRALGKTTATRNDMSVKPWAYAVASPRQAGNFFVKSAVLQTTLQVVGSDESLQYTFGGDLLATQYADDEYGAGHGAEPVTGTITGKAEAALFQASSAGWTWQVAENKIFDPGLKANIAYMKSRGQSKPYYEYQPRYHEILKTVYGCPFMGHRVTVDGEEKARAHRAAGWMDVSDGKKMGVAVAVRDFWQMVPKSLEADGTGRITVGLWPKQWKRGHLFEGRIHRTHEQLYYFHEGDAKTAKVAGQMRAFRAPLVAVIPPKYVVGTGVLGNAVVADAKKYPAY